MWANMWAHYWLHSTCIGYQRETSMYVLYLYAQDIIEMATFSTTIAVFKVPCLLGLRGGPIYAG